MEGLTIIESKALDGLFQRVDTLQQMVESTLAELNGLKKPYYTVTELMDITGFGKTWVNNNKHLIGYTTVGGCLRFRRRDVDAYMAENYIKPKK